MSLPTSTSFSNQFNQVKFFNTNANTISQQRPLLTPNVSASLSSQLQTEQQQQNDALNNCKNLTKEPIYEKKKIIDNESVNFSLNSQTNNQQ